MNEQKKPSNNMLSGEKGFCLTPQVLLEFFATVTNTKRVENPRSEIEVRKEIQISPEFLPHSCMLIVPRSILASNGKTTNKIINNRFLLSQ